MIYYILSKRSLFNDNKKCFKYIDDINPRDLLYSSNNLFKIIKIVYDIINLCVSKYFIKHTKCTYEKNVISGHSITYFDTNYEEVLKIYETYTVLSIFIIILLKNYRSLKSDYNNKLNKLALI